MKFTRREFLRGGVSAFTMGFAAPAFLSDIARAQGTSRRNLVVLYLSGGNDSLSMLVPYTDSFYYSRRPTLAVPAGTVLQIGSDSSGKALGLHPRLGGLREIYLQGRLALIQRTGYQNSSRSHFLGTDIWSTANPANASGEGWLGRYLETLPSPVDPLAGWSTVRELPHALKSDTVGVPSIPNVDDYALQSPNTGVEATYSRAALAGMASHLPPERPHVAFVNATAQGALATLDRVGAVAGYMPTVTYPGSGLGQALQAVAGAMVQGIGTKVFWVQTGGFDTHASQGTNEAGGTYATLMGVVDSAVTAFYVDLLNHGLLGDTLILQFSEFGRRISENGSNGTDHGAAATMMALGGAVQGGLFGTAPSLNPSSDTLENNGADVRFQTDFRSVYARVIDQWLGASSIQVLGADFRNPSLTFV